MSAKKVIGFHVGIGQSYNSEYRHLRIMVSTYIRSDAAKLVADAVREGYQSEANRAMENAKIVREETGATIYYTGDYGSMLEFRWQDDRESRDKWYAPHCELSTPDDETISLLRQIRKVVDCEINRQLDPREMIRKLMAAGAIPVKSLDKIYSGYAEDKDFALSIAIPDFKAPEPVEQSV